MDRKHDFLRKTIENRWRGNPRFNFPHPVRLLIPNLTPSSLKKKKEKELTIQRKESN